MRGRAPVPARRAALCSPPRDLPARLQSSRAPAFTGTRRGHGEKIVTRVRGQGLQAHLPQLGPVRRRGLAAVRQQRLERGRIAPVRSVAAAAAADLATERAAAAALYVAAADRTKEPGPVSSPIGAETSARPNTARADVTPSYPSRAFSVA